MPAMPARVGSWHARPELDAVVLVGGLVRRARQVRLVRRRHGVPDRQAATPGRRRLRRRVQGPAVVPAVPADRRALRVVRPGPHPHRRVLAAVPVLVRPRQPLRCRRDLPRHPVQERHGDSLGHVGADGGGCARAAEAAQRSPQKEGSPRDGCVRHLRHRGDPGVLI